MEHTNNINFAWLLRLRWGILVGQAVLVASARWGLDIVLPLPPLMAIIIAGLATNTACVFWIHRDPEVRGWHLASLMLTDAGLLTALLYYTGGEVNPFSFLYLVNIALGAVVLQAAWNWALVAVSLGCYGLLFFAHVPLPMEHAGGHAHGQSGMWMHLQGMWFAFGITAAFIAYFIQRITRALAHRDADLTAARMLSARQERLASLATLAAGATHELSTPLSTIAVVAKELEHQLENGGGSPDAVEDARLIRRQVDRCREILVQLAADAGESSGEAFRVVSVAELLRLALDGLHDVDRIQLPTDATLIGHTLRIPPRAIARALRAVIKNAREASTADRPITISAEIDHGMWRLAVRDHGEGMTEQTLAHAAEPFFTTKADGGGQSGMGLGLFLARAVLERIGGRLDLDSEVGRGTTAVLTVPMDASPAAQHDARADLAVRRPLISSALGG